MKALKSELAKRVLADPVASKQLRRFLASKMLESGVGGGSRENGPAPTHRPAGSDIIEMRNAEGDTLRVQPVIVPNA